MLLVLCLNSSNIDSIFFSAQRTFKANEQRCTIFILNTAATAATLINIFNCLVRSAISVFADFIPRNRSAFCKAHCWGNYIA